MSLLSDTPADLLRSMLETSPAGISIVSADGTRLYANQTFADLYRFSSPAAALGQASRDVYVHAEDHDRMAGLLARDGGLAAFEVLQRRLDGEEWWCLLDKRPIDYGDQTAFISWHYDITDRKHAEQEAREKAELLTLTLSNIDQGVIVRDADDKVLLFNDKLSEMLGVPRELYERGASTEELNTVHGEKGDIIVTPGAADRLEDWEARRRRGLPVDRLTYERRNAAGEWHLAARQPMANGLEIRTFLDITEQKHAEQEAVEKARILQTTLENMGQGLTMFDENWNLVSYNARYREHFDLPAGIFHDDAIFDDIVGATMRIDYGEEWQERLQVVRDPIRMTAEWRRSFTRPTGRSLDLLSIPVPEGGFVVTSTDITEFKRVEAELLRQQEINRTVLDAMDQGLLMIDRDGRYVLYNNRLCELLGLPEEFLANNPTHQDAVQFQVERGDLDHLSAEERRALMDDVSRLDAAREAFVYERRLADGRVLEIRNNPLQDGGWVRIFNDITARKLAEDAVAEKTRQLELTLESMEQGIILLDEDARTILYNSKASALFGVPESMLASGATSQEYFDYQRDHGEFERVDPKLRQVLDGIIEGQKNSVPVEFSYEREKPDGSWIRVNNIPVEGGGSLRTFLDITAQKIAEDTIAEKTMQLELTLDTMDQGIILLDSQDRTVIYNAKAAAMLGVPVSMLAAGATSQECAAYQSAHGEYDNIEPETRARLEQIIEAHKQGDRSAFSYERLKPNGRWVLVHNIPVDGGGSLRTFLDITERKVAEQTIAEKTRQLELTLETMDQGIMLLDEDNRLTLYNSKVGRFLGVSDSFLAQRPTSHRLVHYQKDLGEFDAVDPEAWARIDKIYDDQRAGIVVPFSYERRKPDGSWIYVNNIPVDGGGFLQTYLDITSRKQAEREALDARDAAENATRAKSAFLAAMSHEIRTPMNGVVGMIEVLEQSSLNEDQRQVTRTVRDSATSLLTIIDDILDFSKIEAGELDLESVPVSVRQIAEGAIDIVGGTAIAKGVDMTLIIGRAVPSMVMADPVRLRQILLNLLGNAVKFTEAGTISVVVDADPAAEAGVDLRFEITDTGIGIAQDRLPSLFQAFQQAEASTTRRFGGTGLGLSICERLVSVMGGEIGAESTVGSGSTFWFTLTLPVSETIAASAIDEIPLDGVSALVVEGSAPTARMLHGLLEDEGIHVTRAASPEDAGRLVAEAAHAGRRHDVLIVDGRFDEAELTDLARHFRVRQEHPNARAIWLHASDALPDSVDPAQTFTQSVPRPVRRDSLLRAVGVVLGRASPDLPVFEGPEVLSDGAVEPPSVEQALAEGRLILVAEDNETNRLVVQRQLSLLGFAAEVAEDGVEALEMFAAKDYGLLLTDCHMPNMDGFDLTKAVREREQATGRHTPIVALTANALVGEAERCLHAGMDDYLAKPVRLRELGETLSRWLGEADRGGPVVAADHGSPPGVGGETTGAGEVEAPPIDQALFEEMIGGADPEMTLMLYEAYAGSSAPLFEAMEEALKTGDPDALRRAAHAAAGAASSIAATPLTDALRRLEGAASEADWSGIEAAMPVVRRRGAAVTSYIKAAAE